MLSNYGNIFKTLIPASVIQVWYNYLKDCGNSVRLYINNEYKEGL